MLTSMRTLNLSEIYNTLLLGLVNLEESGLFLQVKLSIKPPVSSSDRLAPFGTTLQR